MLAVIAQPGSPAVVDRHGVRGGDRRLRIMVVDDEEPIRNLLRIALQRHGFEVWAAASGTEAVERFEEVGADIDLVMLDVQMPGMDGVETLNALRGIDPDIPVCFLTGHAPRYTKTQLLDYGAAEVFTKPFAIARLAGTLRLLVEAVR